MTHELLEAAQLLASRCRRECDRLEAAVQSAGHGERGRRDPLWHLIAQAGASELEADALTLRLRSFWPSDYMLPIAWILETYSPQWDAEPLDMIAQGRIEALVAGLDALGIGGPD